MGRLKDFIAYLDDRIATVERVEKKLCALQAKYESYFSEVTKVRESELEQLTAHILKARANKRGGVRVEGADLPSWFDQSLDKALLEVEREYDVQLGKLKQDRDSLLKKAEQQRISSIKTERALRKKNVSLDREEEDLKARNEKLLAEIKRYNDEIRDLGRGFGFFVNLFKMGHLTEDRRRLDLEQADVAARIEALRRRWSQTEASHEKKELELRERWVELETDSAALQTKIDYLREARSQIVLRSTVERVLFDMVETPPEPAAGDQPCSRCTMPNPATSHFCRICAQRLKEDRPDFEGSLQEIAELNLHHRRFSEGMKACQEIIGLIRGLHSGLEAFKASVVDMRQSERKHNLSPLSIDVPAKSVEYGRHFDALGEVVRQDQSLHPRELARQVEQVVKEVFTEEKIKDYFETMGEELSRQAEGQW